MGFGPLVVIAGVLLSGLVWNTVTHLTSRRPGRPSLITGLLTGLPVATLIALCLTPASSATAFAALNCRYYDDDSALDTQTGFLLAEPSVICGSSQHAELVSISTALIVLWPVGMTVAFAVLLRLCHKSIEAQEPTALSSAIAILHREYHPQYYFFEVVILLQRTTLGGLLLVLPDSLRVLRLQIAVLLSALFLMFAAFAQPFKRKMHNAIFMLASVGYVVTFVSALAILLRENIQGEAGEEYAAPATAPAPPRRDALPRPAQPAPLSP